MVFKFLLFFLTIALFSPCQAGEFHEVFNLACHELTWKLEGGSFIENGKLKKQTPLPLDILNASTIGTAVYLTWSGEVNEIDALVKKITIEGNGKKRILEADNFWTERATGHLYTAAADITKVMKKLKPPYFLSELKSDPIDFTGTGGYSQAGWAVVNVACTGGKGAKGLQFLSTAESVPPGDPLTVRLPIKNALIQRLGIFGGHGLEGNGGGNLLNGLAITGKDDWQGKTGELWDVGTYEVSAWGLQKDWSITFDPLLEWVFPSGIIIESNVN